MKSALKRWWWLILLVPLALVAGFVIWASNPLGPMPEALAALESDSRVLVQVTPWYIFRPAQGTPQSGVIFYPGGRVDPRSYAPAARALAAQGYLAVITPMPLNLAVFAPGRAADVIAAYPEIQTWALGGHSLGGAMAANFARKNPAALQELFLWAAYPTSSDDLSGQALAVASVSASLDGLATPDEIAASRPLLPPSTAWVVIEGGNHAQFGWYGDQPGDNPAAITREAQQQQALEATLVLLQMRP
jgi:dienelactone hydrolase